jgi:hypothetical protein
MKLVKIVTHHKNPRRAAEIYLKMGLIAIGYVYEKGVAKKNKERIKEYFRNQRKVTEQKVGQGTSIFLRFRDEIEKGDVVFAYAASNRIALVGEIIGPHTFNDKNIVGDEEGEIGYPNQRRVKWWHACMQVVGLLPDHKRLVLFPTKVTYKINDTIKEKARPTDEVIDRLAKVNGSPIVIFPIGWAHEFFGRLPENPLQKLFPGCQPLEDFVIKDEKRKKNISKLPAVSEGTEPKQFVDLKFPERVGNVTQYLGLVSPIIRVSSVMENSSPEYEEYLIRTWLKTRSDSWQWFSSNLITGKMIVGDLNIDKKARIWTLDLREYSSTC